MLLPYCTCICLIKHIKRKLKLSCIKGQTEDHATVQGAVRCGVSGRTGAQSSQQRQCASQLTVQRSGQECGSLPQRRHQLRIGHGKLS